LKASGLTALEEKWRVGPLTVTDQTLSLKYGSIGDNKTTNRVIEFYARPISRGGPTTGNENIELNCFSKSGAIQASPPAGFGIETTINDREMLLAITFKRATWGATGDSIESFDGYRNTDSNAFSVEFCVKLTVGGKIFRELAVKYAFTLDGAIRMNDAAVFNDDSTSENILKILEYGINAYLCDVAGVKKTESEVFIGKSISIYICLESDNEQASASSVYDLSLTVGDKLASPSTYKKQAVVSTDASGAVVVLNLIIESCADSKCTYEVILDHDMFEAIASKHEGTTTITVIGNAKMELGTHAGRRSLEITPPKKDDL
jgi:hypothetical protein